MRKGGNTETLEAEAIVEDVLDYQQMALELTPTEE